MTKVGGGIYALNPHQKEHPLSVAMEDCRQQQHASAETWLNTDIQGCHKVFADAYLSCFAHFAQAQQMLEREDRMPQQISAKAARAATKAKQAREARSLPPELKR